MTAVRQTKTFSWEGADVQVDIIMLNNIKVTDPNQTDRRAEAHFI